MRYTLIGGQDLIDSFLVGFTVPRSSGNRCISPKEAAKIVKSLQFLNPEDSKKDIFLSNRVILPGSNW